VLRHRSVLGFLGFYEELTMTDTELLRHHRLGKPLIDYRHSTTMPIRDMHRDGKIVFYVDIYGWDARDVCVIPDGAEPMLKAVRRLGLDPDRYQAWIWDAPV
jgi:hypothetical protein